MTTLATRHGNLWVRTHGVGPPQVVALHGFTLHGGMFATLAGVAGITIAAPDLPGHGRSAVEPVTIGAAVDVVADLLRTLDPPPLLLGYSQGGRVALQVALTYAELVGSLVLVATSPGLNERARRLRAVADEGLASRIERIGTSRFIDEWLANPMVATDRVDAEARRVDRAIRLENGAEGLAAALRGMGQASVRESLDRIAGLPMPVLFIAGSNDSKYSDLATTMASLRREEPLMVANAGHNVILEAPEAIAAELRRFLRID